MIIKTSGENGANRIWKSGRGARIRTEGLLFPKQVL